jgi:hypothetical protein
MNTSRRSAAAFRCRVRASAGRTALFALGLAPLWNAPGAQALPLDIRPIDFGGGIKATGTITTAGDTADIVDWQLTVSSFERLARYTGANTPLKLVVDVSVSDDGRFMTVATSPEGVEDGGTLARGWVIRPRTDRCGRPGRRMPRSGPRTGTDRTRT